MNIILTKQKSYSNEGKIKNKRIKKIKFLYYLVNERFVPLST